MAEITAASVGKLREMTGAGLMDCKKALAENNGDLDLAVDWLRKKGVASAAKKADRAANEGVISQHIIPGSKVGVLLEVNCETDFVARSEEFQKFSRDIAMHICASEPQYVHREEVPAEVIEKEREIALGQAQADPKNANKPANILEKMVQGRIDKFLTDAVLLQQPFVKDQAVTVGELVTGLTAKTGEKISIRRFTRYKLGEGLEKRSDDFAAEVAAMNQ